MRTVRTTLALAFALVLAGGTFLLLAEGRGAGGDFTSDPFTIQPGYIANWRLPDNNVSVR